MSEPRIRVLSQTLIDQIAAGEVVERPASVAKELIENSLDAGARRIEVTLERGGLGLLRVVDDGGGMTQSEAHLALRRHATSKLQAFVDLESLATMGFRGEALPSIASVSRMTLVTRTAAEEAGYQLVVAGGEVERSGPSGAPVGTSIEVRDLFYNVPARLKFMKAEATEMTHTVDAVVRLALAHASVHFRLKSGARTLLDLPPHPTVQERVKAALGRNARSVERLVPARGADRGVTIDAYLGPPDEAAHTTRSTYLFVNRRFVRDRALLSALGLGYGELLDKGRYPLAVVFLTLDGKAVDVNVHPQKTEVRFAEPQWIASALRHTVAQAVAEARWSASVESTPVRVYSMPPTAVSDPGRGYPGHRKRAAEALKLFAPPPRSVDERGPPPSPLFVQALEGGLAVEDAKRAARGELPPLAPTLTELPAGAALGPGGVSSSPLTTMPGFFSGLRYLGQLDRTYLLCEADRELVLIDQHSAHERVAFQRLKESYEHRRVHTQRLLLPIALPCSAEQGAALQAERPFVEGLGFELSFDDAAAGTVWLRGVPDDLAKATPEVLGQELLAQLGSASAPGASRLDAMLAQLACHSVVRAGDVLAPSEVEALLRALDAVDHRAPAPHGRPVLLRISLAEIERRFGRT